MLYTYSNTDQTVAVNGVVALGNNGVSTCGCISHAAGTGSVSLQRAGCCSAYAFYCPTSALAYPISMRFFIFTQYCIDTIWNSMLPHFPACHVNGACFCNQFTRAAATRQ